MYVLLRIGKYRKNAMIFVGLLLSFFNVQNIIATSCRKKAITDRCSVIVRFTEEKGFGPSSCR